MTSKNFKRKAFIVSQNIEKADISIAEIILCFRSLGIWGFNHIALTLPYVFYTRLTITSTEDPINVYTCGKLKKYASSIKVIILTNQ